MKIEKLEDLPKGYVRDWYAISGNLILTENFIRDHQDKVNWWLVSKYQNLSESFIREFKHKVDWFCISKYQKLNEDFIREFHHRVNWNFIRCYQKLSKEFIEEFSSFLSEYKILKVVHNCGDNNRPIYITKDNPNKVVIGCGSFTKEEAIVAINKKYKGDDALDYINKVNECFNF